MKSLPDSVADVFALLFHKRRRPEATRQLSQEWISNAQLTFLSRAGHASSSDLRSSACTFGDRLFLLKSHENWRLSRGLESGFCGAWLSALLEPGGGKAKN